MKHLFKRTLIVVVFFLASCSSSQLTFYQPTGSDASLKVTVDKNSITNNFICKINDTEVAEESFGFFSNSFEKDGQYHGKKVIMSGYKKAHTVYKGKGESTTEDSYLIKIFIDGKEAGKFDF
jgi:hypothetical protein